MAKLGGMKTAHRANYSVHPEGVRVRVICPGCGAGGAQYLKSYQPKCHICAEQGKEVLMLPGNNHAAVCSWKDAVEYGRLYEEEQIPAFGCRIDGSTESGG